MPQYRRNKYKCLCVASVASTYEEALKVLPCPFAMHTVANGAIGWKHCNDGIICNYEDIYKTIRDEIADDPHARQTCLAAISYPSKVQPSGPASWESQEKV